MIRVVHPGPRIPDPYADFYPSRIPDPGVKKAPDPGSATLVPTLLSRVCSCELQCEVAVGYSSVVDPHNFVAGMGLTFPIDAYPDPTFLFFLMLIRNRLFSLMDIRISDPAPHRLRPLV
jgi:hypothetical protein